MRKIIDSVGLVDIATQPPKSRVFSEPCGIPCLTVWLPSDSQCLTTLTLSTYSSGSDMIMTSGYPTGCCTEVATSVCFGLKESQWDQFVYWELQTISNIGEMKTETLNPIKSLALFGREWNVIWRASVSCNFAFCCFYNLVSIVENEQGVYGLSGNIKFTMLR